MFTKRKYDWDAVQAFYDTGVSARATILHFGMSANTWYKAAKKGWITLRGRQLIPLKVLLVANRPQTGRTHLKNRLIKAGKLENKCSRCGINEWLGEPLSLQLEHKNGSKKDNRKRNLCLLCPNCHSQTKTFGGRNRKLLRNRQR